MNSDLLLKLIPTHFLCPYCGEWHEYTGRHSLRDGINLRCSHAPNYAAESNYAIDFYLLDGPCCQIQLECERSSSKLETEWIQIDSIAERGDETTVTWRQLFDYVYGNSERCSGCKMSHVCNVKVDVNDDCEIIEEEITLGFKFEQSDYDRGNLSAILEAKEHKSEEKGECREKFDAEEFGQKPAEQLVQQEIKEDVTMENNILNMEFGLNKDENIASTLLGVAVKNGNSWRIYDKKKKEITDIGDMQLGNFPIFILPTTKLHEGDLIKDAGEYYFVVKASKGNTQTLCVKTGEMKTVIPIKNVLGFSCYTKVIAFNDSMNPGDDFDIEKLAMMSAMCQQNGGDGNQMNQLLPLMFFKDKLGIDEDMMKMMIMSSMMSAPAEGSNQNVAMDKLAPLMLLENKDDDMMKKIIIVYMMGGNMVSNNNPVISYLMLDRFMGEKKDKQPPQQSGK